MADRFNRAAYRAGQAYGFYRYFRYLVPVAIIIVSGLAFLGLVFGFQSVLFATVSAILWTVAWWKAFYYWEHDSLPMFQDHPFGERVVGALVGMVLSGASYLFVNLGTGQTLFEIGPPSLLLVMFFIYQADLLYRALEGVSHEVTGGAGLSPGMKAVYFGFAILLVGFLSFQFALGGDWGNLAQVAGPAGSVTAEVVQTAADTAATSTNYVVNSITNSPGFVRMECVLESGGIAGAAFTPSTEISECVERKMNGSTTSEQVTEPVELRLGGAQIRPDWQADGGDGEMEVSVEATNTFVNDVAGRPLTIPARDVAVTATWTWRNTVVARNTSEVEPEIPNGNFEIFQFTFPLDRYASDPENASEGHIAAGFQEYALQLNASYTFDAEAAFTDSSRWNTGDHTLKVWDYDAWVSRPDDFRQQWANDNCQQVAFQDFTYSVQRTGALTTPIMPVVYADCGNRLAQDHADDGAISIDMSATQSDNPRSEVSVDRFRIEDAVTDCDGGSADPLTPSDWSEVGAWQTEFVEAIGWDVTPHRVQRDVDIQGERTTISCFLNMSITVGLQGVQRSGITIRNETVG